MTLISTCIIKVGRTAGGHFVKGQSCGNSAGGVPPGSRNHATRTAEILLDGEAEALALQGLCPPSHSTVTPPGVAALPRPGHRTATRPAGANSLYHRSRMSPMPPTLWRRSPLRLPKAPLPRARAPRSRRWSTPMSGRLRRAISTGG